MADNSGLHNKTLAPNSNQQLSTTGDSTVSGVSTDHSYNLITNGQTIGSNNSFSSPPSIESPEVHSVIPLGSLQMLDDIQQKKLENNLDATSPGQEAMEQSFTTASTHSETSSLEDTMMEEVPLSNRMSDKEEAAPRRSRRHKIPVDKDFPPSHRKRKQSHKTSPTKTHPKRGRISKNNSYKKFIESHDKDVLLEMLLEEVDGKRILEAYKKNRSTKEVQQEVSQVFEVGQANVCANPEIVSMLRTSLVGFSKVLSEDLYMDTVMENIGYTLKASKLIRFMKPEQAKEAMLQTITDGDVLGRLFKSNNPVIYKKILSTVPDEVIIKEVQARENLNASETLLNILLENYSQIVPEEQDMDSDDPDSVPVKPTSQIALMDNMTTVVDSKRYLNKSEPLLNVMLQKGPDVYSKETKKNIENVILKKFSADEFNELSYKVTKYHLSSRIHIH